MACADILLKRPDMLEVVTALLPKRILARATLACGLALAPAAHAQMSPGAPPPPPGQVPVNPVCPRLEAQLATIDRGGNSDPAKDDQIRRY